MLRLKVEGALWSGHEVQEITYEQQYSLQEELVYHAAMEFSIVGPSSAVSNKLRTLWSKRDLQPTRDKAKGRDLVEREGGIEWIKGAGNKTVFATEFYE